jgi:hypothetical protein
MNRSARRWGAAGLSAAVVAILWHAAGAAASATLAGAKVDNFMLADQSGMGHELYYYNANPAIVLVSSAEGDKVSERAAKALAKVREAFKGKNVQFMMLDSSPGSKHDKFVGTPGSADLPVLADELQLVGRATIRSRRKRTRRRISPRRSMPCSTASRCRSRTRL